MLCCFLFFYWCASSFLLECFSIILSVAFFSFRTLAGLILRECIIFTLQLLIISSSDKITIAEFYKVIGFMVRSSIFFKIITICIFYLGIKIIICFKIYLTRVINLLIVLHSYKSTTEILYFLSKLSCILLLNECIYSRLILLNWLAPDYYWALPNCPSKACFWRFSLLESEWWIDLRKASLIWPRRTSSKVYFINL